MEDRLSTEENFDESYTHCGAVRILLNAFVFETEELAEDAITLIGAHLPACAPCIDHLEAAYVEKENLIKQARRLEEEATAAIQNQITQSEIL